jgi:hypothetical protein
MIETDIGRAGSKRRRRQAITTISAPLPLCKGFSFYPSRNLIIRNKFTVLSCARDANGKAFLLIEILSLRKYISAKKLGVTARFLPVLHRNAPTNL